MSINRYFTLDYLVRFGYFDFKPSPTREEESYLIGNAYMLDNTFYSKIFNCDKLFDKLSCVMNKSNFNSHEETIPIEFTIYKTDETRRIYKMPNIYSYIRLAQHLEKYKETYIEIIESSDKSLSKDFYNKSFLENKKPRERNRFGMNYIFETDIQEFYPSMYTHSIPWMLVGKKKAKSKKGDKTKYYNNLDNLIQQCQYGETYGIPMGTFASRLISEIYLCKLDCKLSKHRYVRYVDDYELAYNLERDQQNFYNDLTNELKDINLKIKTEKNNKIKFPFNQEDNSKNLKAFFDDADLINSNIKHQSKKIHEFINCILMQDQKGIKGVLKLLFLILRGAIKGNKVDKRAISTSVMERLLNLVLMKPILGGYFLELFYDIKDIEEKEIIEGVITFDNPKRAKKIIEDIITSNEGVFKENIDRYIELGYHQELYSLLSIFYLLDIDVLEEDLLFKIINKMDDFNVILAIYILERMDTIDWNKLFSELEQKLSVSSKWEDSFWLLKYEIFYRVKWHKKSMFTKKYKEYICNKYNINHLTTQEFFETKNLKQIQSNIIFESHNKNGDSQISKFFRNLIDEDVNFFNKQ